MKIKNWIACVQDRVKWKEVVEKAKTFKQEVQRLEEEEEEEEDEEVTHRTHLAFMFNFSVPHTERLCNSSHNGTCCNATRA